MKIGGSGDMGSIPIVPLIIILQDQYGISLVKDTHQAMQRRPRAVIIPPLGKQKRWAPRLRQGTLTVYVGRMSRWAGRVWYLEELQWEASKGFHSNCYWRTVTQAYRNTGWLGSLRSHGPYT